MVIIMKGYIFGTPFYTKTDWHTGRLILSRNGQTKGFGNSDTMKYARRLSFAIGAHAEGEKGYKGTTIYKGKKVSRFNVAVAQNAQVNQSFGGQAAREADRANAIRATGAKLSHMRPASISGPFGGMQSMSRAVEEGYYPY
jgi:hypothetical protein